MGAQITYMGTKRALAANVVEVVRAAQPGVLLDAFSGMCAVGSAVANDRQIWNNDVQVFAAEVARALFLSRSGPPSALTLADACCDVYVSHRRNLDEKFRASLGRERDLTNSATFSVFEDRQATFAARLRADTADCRRTSYRLFLMTYAGNFFGLQQAIEIDAIVRALHTARSKRTISAEVKRWALIALGRTLLKISNSTGHFAQFLRPNENTYRRYLKLRRRSVWEEWLNSLAVISPIRDCSWRSQNRVFNGDCLALLARLAKTNSQIAAIYADPPYTEDQYSRFYHILETLLLYDYPAVSGAGLYRHDRFQTPFSLRSKASASIERFVTLAAKTGADLVLSYPMNGIAISAGLDITALLRKHYRKVEVSRTMVHQHSTFGASKGVARTSVTELLYLARA